MTISDFLSRHQGQDLVSPNEIIQINSQLSELLNNVDKLHNIIEALKDIGRLNTIDDILCPAKKAPSAVKRGTRKTVQPGEVTPIWPLTGETRRPEHVPQMV